MKWDAWRFSAHLAWQDAFVRWTTVVPGAVTVTWISYYLWRLIPEGLRSGVLVLHYNIYLGIDDVRAWPWIFLSPGIMLLILLTNTSIAFGLYRTDTLAARTLMVVSVVLVAIWIVSSFFLIHVNL